MTPASARVASALVLAALAAACGGGGGGGGDGGGGGGPVPDTTAPAVVSFAPSNAATGVARGGTIAVTFSEAVDPATVTPATVTLTGPSGTVGWTSAWSAGNTVLTLTPSSPLANYAAHTVQLGTGVRDAAGNGLAAVTSASFTTLDDVAPAAPADPAGPGLANLATPSATFTWPAPADDGAGVASYDWAVALDTTGSPAVLTGTVAAPATAMTLLALGPYDGQALFARARARDTAGNVGAWSGWSGPTRVDLSAPLATLDPADATTGVPRAGSFHVTFSEEVDPATVTAATVALETEGGVAVDHARALAGGVLTLTPSAPLAHHGLYRIRVTAGVLDTATNPVVPAASIFRAADEAPPVLVGQVLDAGSFDDGAVTFTWAEGATDVGAGVAGYLVRAAVGSPVFTEVPTFVTTTAWTLDASAASFLDGSAVFAEVLPVDLAGNAGLPGISDGVVLDKIAPGAPGQPVGPGAYALASPVRFAWGPALDAGSGVAGYDVVAATATMGGTSLAATAPGAATFTDVTAGDGVTVYVQVTARDAVGNAPGDPSGWSELVTMDLLDPTAPSTITRAAGAVLASPVQFDWAAGTDSNGIAHHVVQVTTGPNGTGAQVYLGTTTETSLSVDAADGTVLHARVRAVDNAGRSGSWSVSSAPVTVDAAGPLAPGRPDDGDVTGATLQVSWSAATDASGEVATYRVEASADPGFWGEDVLGIDAGNVTSTTFVDVSRWDGLTVYTRVMAVDTFAQDGAWSQESDGVLVDTSPPTMPGIPQDAGDYSASTTLHFFWTPSGDATSGVAGYTCEIGEGAARTFLATLESAVPSCDYVAAMNQTVFARVRARDVVGNVTADFTDWSDGILVTTAVPGTPGTPSDEGRYLDDETVSFTWTEPPGFQPGDVYVVQIGTSPGASDVVPGIGPDLELDDADYTFEGTHGVTYHARVAARSGGMTGAFSASSDGVTVDLSEPGAPAFVWGSGTGVDDETVTFEWTAAEDPESGIASYDVEITVNGGPSLTFATATASFTYGPAFDGESVQARVRAVNGAGRQGVWSDPSAPIQVDAVDPIVWRSSPWSGTHPTGVDVVLEFSEDMDVASVESAVAVSWDGGTTPAHGYVFHWNGGRTVTIVPDTHDPQGETNVDLLPERKVVTVAVAGSATDLAGNGLPPFSFQFDTADETAPRLVSLTDKADGTSSPFAPGFGQGIATLVARFDEDMDTSRGSFYIELGNGRRIETSIGNVGVQGVAQGGGQMTYALAGTCPDIRVGDRVAVRDTSPRDFEVSLAEVLAVVAGPSCQVTVDAGGPAGATYGGGGWMTVPGGNGGGGSGGRAQWTSARDLELEFAATSSFPPGSERMIELWNVNDLSWNHGRVRAAIQIRPGADTTPPQVISSIPQSGSAAPGTRPIVLRFSEPVRADTASGITAECLGCEGLYDVQYTPDRYGPIVVLTPRASPPEGAVVTVSVPATVLDLAGNAAQPSAVTFTVAPYGDVGGLQVRESVPGDGEPVDFVSRFEVSFEDSETGLAGLLDSRSVGPNDVQVVDEWTGLLVRGFRVEVEPRTGVLALSRPGGGGAFSSGWESLEVSSVIANGFDPVYGTSIATYTTIEPHQMWSPGAFVHVSMYQPEMQGFGVWNARVLDVPSPNHFVVAWNGGDAFADGGGTPIGNASTPFPKWYEVWLLDTLDADGILDAHGNGLEATWFEVNVQPWPDRTPQVESLRDVRIAAETSSVARTLDARARVRDADGGQLTVSLWDWDGGSMLSGTERTVSAGSMYGGGDEYRFPGDDGGGPPMVDDPPELGAYNASGYYPVELVLDDGAWQKRYRRDVWIWSPDAVPQIAGIDDGGTIRAAGAKPLVVEADPRPAFGWTNMDAENADLGALYVLPLDLLDEPRDVIPFAPQAEGWATLSSDLEPGVYLWTVLQQKFGPGSSDLESSGWAIDLGQISRALFAYGPDNRALEGAQFAGARAGLAPDAGGLDVSAGARGTWTFEEATPAAAPVIAAAALVDHRGNPLPPSEDLFAYEVGKRFTITQPPPPSGGEPIVLPMPMHGGLGLGGTFFATAQESPVAPGLQAAAYRHRSSGFGGSLDARFAYVQTEASVSGASASGGATVGYATFDPALALSVVGVRNDGSAFEEIVDYALADDGLVTLQLGDGATAAGLIGGSDVARIAVLANADATDDQYFWLLMAEAYPWDGSETTSLVAGTYRFADLMVAYDGGALSDAHAASGTMTFDGSGNVVYEGGAADFHFSGYGSYTVDAATGAVTFQRLDSNPGPTIYTLVVGPGADLLLGASTDPALPGVAEVIVLTR